MNTLSVKWQGFLDKNADFNLKRMHGSLNVAMKKPRRNYKLIQELERRIAYAEAGFSPDTYMVVTMGQIEFEALMLFGEQFTNARVLTLQDVRTLLKSQRIAYREAPLPDDGFGITLLHAILEANQWKVVDDTCSFIKEVQGESLSASEDQAKNKNND